MAGEDRPQSGSGPGNPSGGGGGGRRDRDRKRRRKRGGSGGGGGGNRPPEADGNQRAGGPANPQGPRPDNRGPRPDNRGPRPDNRGGGSGGPRQGQQNRNQRGGPQGNNQNRGRDRDRDRDRDQDQNKRSGPPREKEREEPPFVHQTMRYGIVVYDTFAAAKADLEGIATKASEVDQLNIVVRQEGEMDDPDLIKFGKVFAGEAWALIHDRRIEDGWYNEPR